MAPIRYPIVSEIDCDSCTLGGLAAALCPHGPRDGAAGPICIIAALAVVRRYGSLYCLGQQALEEYGRTLDVVLRAFRGDVLADPLLPQVGRPGVSLGPEAYAALSSVMERLGRIGMTHQEAVALVNALLVVRYAVGRICRN